MTHEELLAKIEDEASYQTLIQALRAVVELHKPYNSVNACTFDDLDYPCPTIQAIKKELG